MKWKGRRQSSNVEDRRGQSGPSQGFGGFSSQLIRPLFKLLFSKIGLVIVGLFLVFSFVTGNNPLTLLNRFFSVGTNPTETQSVFHGTPHENELAEFSATI